MPTGRPLQRTLEKLLVAMTVVLAAMVVCGVFGALHDQISYTVSPEYYTRFKFIQFGRLAMGSERLSVANVGFQASWWMGLPIGTTLATVGLFAPDGRGMGREALRAFVVVAAVALGCGLVGLLWGVWTFRGPNPAVPDQWYIPEGGVHDLAAFLRADSMHNASYLGGVLGTLVASVVMSRRVVALRHMSHAGSR